MKKYKKEYPSKWQNQYTEEFKRMVCLEFLKGSETRKQVERKYNLGNSRLACWLKDYGYVYEHHPSIYLPIMPETPKPTDPKAAQIKQLKKELEDAKLLAEAYKRMIVKAEQELKISIRKKSSTE